MKFKEIIKKNYVYLIIIIILGLTPLLWFKSGYIITGTDINYPLFPINRFIDRSFVWDPTVIGGADRSNNTASLANVGPQAILDIFGISIITNEKITFIYWFLFSGLAMYFLLSIVIGDEYKWQRMAKFCGTVIYMFNFYLAFLWLRLQLETSALILFPLYLGCLIAISQKRMRISVGLLILSFFTIINGPLGLQPPLIYIMFIMLFLYVIYYSVFQISKKQWKNILRIIGIMFLIGIIFVLSSAYWAIPLVKFIYSSGFDDSSVGEDVYAVRRLIEYTSNPTSLLRIFRFLGDVGWFDSWGGEKYSPEVYVYLEYPMLIFLSFILPIVVFSVLLITKKIKNKLIPFFALVALIGLFFSKGSHSPFGQIYLWCVDNIPLFWIQRAPWQKFTILTVIGYSVLGGIGFGYIYKILDSNLVKSKKIFNFNSEIWLKSIFIFLFLLFILGYNYLFVLGQMFPDREGEVGYHRKYNLGFHQKFPDYFFKIKDYINSQKDYYKILLLPDDRVDVYDWGYGGSSPITSLIFNKGIVYRQYGEGFAPPHSSENVNALFTSLLYDGSFTHNAVKILDLLGVKYALQRNDFRYDFFGDIDNPEFIKEKISLQKNIKKEKEFGKWDLYKIENETPFIYTPQNIVYINSSDFNAISPLLNNESFNSLQKPVVIFKNDDIQNKQKINSFPNIYDLDYEIKKDVTVIDKYVEEYGPDLNKTNSPNLSIAKAILYDNEKKETYQSNTAKVIELSAKNLFLIIIKTGNKPLVINKILSHGLDLLENVEEILVNQNNTKNSRGQNAYPIIILPNQEINILINNANNIINDKEIELETQDIEFKEKNIIVKDGNKTDFDWDSDQIKNNKELVGEALYYSGNKSIIADNGTSTDRSTFVFNNPKEVPYKMMNNATRWNAYNSTLLYLKTPDYPISINKLSINGSELKPLVAVWWETDSVGTAISQIIFPLLIPKNQKVIIQVDKEITGNINLIYSTLTLTGNQINKIIIPVEHRKGINFDWEEDKIKNNKEIEVNAIFYKNNKGVISDSGSGESDMLIFDKPEDVPYIMLNNTRNWSANNSSLVYIKTADQSLMMSKIRADYNKQILPVVGIWQETKGVGAGGLNITYPQFLTKNQKIIIQINDKIDGKVYFNFIPAEVNKKFDQEVISTNPNINFARINPIKYKVRLSKAKEQFLLVTKENFNNWKLYLNNDTYNNEQDKYKNYFWETWFKKPVSEDNHLMANGYANSWVINPEEVCTNNDKCVKNPDGTYDFEMIIEFWPQRLFYIGLVISGLTLLSCIGYLIYDWRKRRKEKSK